MKSYFFILSILLYGFFFSSVAAYERLKLATTTSTANSGLLNYLNPIFKEKSGVRVDAIAVGTGKALKLGQNGDVDVMLVHAREAEETFIKEGHGVNRKDVMYNDFIIVGPASDAAGINGMDDVILALRKIS